MDSPVPGGPVEYDADGVPYYKWPPFPVPPPGVDIVSFKNYKASGIQVAMLDEEVELDGKGIPTVQLNVKHDGEERPKKKQKKNANSTLAADGSVKRTIWWQEWAEGEDLRSNFNYDRMLHITDRLTSAAEDFRKSRTWPPRITRVQDWWDRWQVFIGIIGRETRPTYQARDEDNVEDVDSDDDEFTGTGSGRFTPQAPLQPVAIQDIDLSQIPITDGVGSAEGYHVEDEIKRVRDLQTRESRLEGFVANPVNSTKIFFSSYFRTRGMLWENAALRDCPRVILFFLNFLIRNRALPEIESELRRAITIAEKAQEELPQTKIIGLNVPDELSRCLTSLFGSRERKFDWSSTAKEAEEGRDRSSKTPSNETDDNSFEKVLEENNVLMVNASDVLPSPPSPPTENSTVTDSNADSWGSTNWGESTGDTWGGASDFGGAESSRDATGKNEDMATDNPWAQPISTAGWTIPVHFLMTHMGPTTLPLTHKVGYVEESTRYIKSWSMPSTPTDGRAVASNDLSMFAKVVLSPHRTFFRIARAAIKRPELLEDPYRGEIREGTTDNTRTNPDFPRHNPTADDIVVYVLPKTAETLIQNMNIGGTFVQVVPDLSWKEQQTGDDKGQGEGKNLRTQHTYEVFWYIEKLFQILPSYWYEMKPENRGNLNVA